MDLRHESEFFILYTQYNIHIRESNESLSNDNDKFMQMNASS